MAITWAAVALPPAYGMPPFHVVTTNLPPLAMAPGSNEAGALTEVVEELARRVNAPVRVELMPWKRAALLPEHLSRFAIYPLTRSREREPRFRWLVRLYQEHNVFTAQSNRPDIDLQNPDSLKKCSVAVVRASSNITELKEDGFTRLVDVTDVQSGLRMLQEGIVDLTYGSNAVYRATPATMGYASSNFRYGPPVHKVELWLGGSKDFTDDDVAELQKAMKSMQADGSYARLLKKYNLTLPPDSR